MKLNKNSKLYQKKVATLKKARKALAKKRRQEAKTGEDFGTIEPWPIPALEPASKPTLKELTVASVINEVHKRIDVLTRLAAVLEELDTL